MPFIAWHWGRRPDYRCFGGDALGSTWTYNAGVVATITTPVRINASEVVNYLSTGPLTIQAGNITVDANVASATSNSFVLKSLGNITQNANKSIQTNGGEILSWADTDINGGYIYMLDGATLDSRTSADRTAGNTATAAGGDESHWQVASTMVPMVVWPAMACPMVTHGRQVLQILPV
jgi:hypothetical protein